MAAPTDVLSRIDEIEGELRGLSAELHELRALVTQAAVAPVAEPTPAGSGRIRSCTRGARRTDRASARRPGQRPPGCGRTQRGVHLSVG